jgi:hypothetical protein
MNFNKESVSKLLKLSDTELATVLEELAREAGVGGEGFTVGNADVKKIRAFLSLASEDEIASLLRRFGGATNG